MLYTKAARSSEKVMAKMPDRILCSESLMNIRSTQPALKSGSLAVTPPKSEAAESDNLSPQTEEEKLTRPVSEKWVVGETTYADTSELLSQLKLDSDNVDAVFHYKKQDEQAPFTQSEKLKNAFGGAVGGAAAGVLGGGLLAGGMAILGFLGDLASVVTRGSGSGITSSALMIPLIGGALIGAASGAVSSYKQTSEPETNTVSGTLGQQNGKLVFYPKGDVKKKVDLEAFNQAETPELKVPEQEEVSVVAETLKGAGAGVLLAPASFIPAAGIAMPFIWGADIGDKLNRGRTSMPGALGALAGLGAAAGSIYAATQHGWTGLAVAAGTLGIAGAVVGNQLAKAPAFAERDFGSQWWTRHTDRTE